MRLLLLASILAACAVKPVKHRAPADAHPGPADGHPTDDPCAPCTADELCVQLFDGVCDVDTECVPRTVTCPDNACTPECEHAYCGTPYRCTDRSPCGGEVPGAFTCYGP